MRDTRSTEIKRILRKAYPKAQFKVWIHKYSMGESIYVRTDLIKKDSTGLPTIEESNEYTKAIRKLLSGYESIDRDQWGEILGGGNTFLFIQGL